MSQLLSEACNTTQPCMTGPSVTSRGDLEKGGKAFQPKVVTDHHAVQRHNQRGGPSEVWSRHFALSAEQMVCVPAYVAGAPALQRVAACQQRGGGHVTQQWGIAALWHIFNLRTCQQDTLVLSTQTSLCTAASMCTD